MFGRGRFEPLLLGLLLGLGAEPASADSTPSTWSEVRTEHFRVLGHEAPERVEEIAIAAERLFQVLDRVAPSPAAARREPITCFAFDSFESYRLFARAGSDSGYLVPHAHGVYAAFVSGQEPTRQIYRHVVTLLLETRFPSLPEWFRQGAAEVYSALEIDGGRLILGRAIPTHLMFLRSAENRLPISVVVESEPDRAAGITGFAIRSWALVHYLVFGDRSLRPKVDLYLRLIAELERPRRAFLRAFGVPPDEMGDLVDAYILQESLPAGALDLGELPAIETSSRRLTRSEAVLAFAELTLHTSTDPQPRLAEVLRELAAEGSADAALWTTLGEAEAALGNADAAGRALRRAVALDPEAYKAWLLLGEALAEGVRTAGTDAQPEAIEEAISALEKAVALRPTSLAAWDRLSFVHAAHAKPSEAAIAAGEKALELRPGRTDLVFNLLLMRAKRGEIDPVRRLVDRLAALGADEALVTSGREMLLQLTLKGTRELMLAKRLDDAIGVLSEVQARTTSERLRATALDWIAQVRSVQQHNLFVERYNQAVRAYNASDWERAAQALAELAAIAQPGEQQLTAERLRAEVEYWRD